MSVKAIYGPGFIAHVSVVDAVFRDENGQPVAMDFHPYCGPDFRNKDDEWIEPSEHVWAQFHGWWEAKGKARFQREIDIASGNFPDDELVP